jgi:small subunit ribosomal protein S20
LATHKSAIKRARQNEVRRLRNKNFRTRSKNVIKEIRTAIADNSADQARESLKNSVSVIQKSASKGVIHKNTAARKISRLSRRINQLTAS